uniref:Xylanase inhibitor C-terminal domain-containing protein n=1 Tax=Nicotiana tabacum TaxID=4097 RepID=A0A1S3ZER4_TOBAC|nr:PREDICTED: uncharacterized protein LOC107785889 [Nicotiana tabacum]
MTIPGQDYEAVTVEKAAKLELEKWLIVKESVLKQKSRLQWLKLGDSNTAYFRAYMKNRQARNNIGRITNSTGQILQSSTEVEEEILSFYRGLLCTTATQLPVVNPEMMQNGNTLNRRQQLQHIKSVTKEEVRQYIMDIDDNKVIGCDGYNLFFFKKTWHTLGEEVTTTVIEFFENADMCRLITNNIIMSHELVKGYGRKNIFPRCMLKIDMQKAYFVKWVYIEQVMKLLGFLEVFVKWIMACIRIGSYSVLINGTVFTRLVEPAYTAVRNEFRRRMARKKAVTSLGGFDTCYTVPITIPTITLMFAGMEICCRKDNFLIRSSSSSTTCLAMAASPANPVNSVLNVIT